MEKIAIIPTYNEKENIAAILEAVFALDQDYHVLIIDDSSPDGTADIGRNLQHLVLLADNIHSFYQLYEL